MSRFQFALMCLLMTLAVPFLAALTYDQQIPKIPDDFIVNLDIDETRRCYIAERDLIFIMQFRQHVYHNDDYGLGAYIRRAEHQNCEDLSELEFLKRSVPDPTNPARYFLYYETRPPVWRPRVHAYLRFADEALAAHPEEPFTDKALDFIGLNPDRRGYHHGLGLLRDILGKFRQQTDTESFSDYVRCGYRLDLTINRDAFRIQRVFGTHPVAGRHEESFEDRYDLFLHQCYEWIEGALPASEVFRFDIYGSD